MLGGLVSKVMGLLQSKEVQLHQHVINGNIQGIKTLHQQGANIEWFDDEGRTPLIVACTKPQLYDAANTLIQLGANVNAQRPGLHARTALHYAAKKRLEETVKLFLFHGGCHGETALHHAAKEGLERTVRLLLSNGANTLAVNDDRQTPLEVARVKGHSNVVRTIESHICFFSGWLRELQGPDFMEALLPRSISKKIWVVVVPSGSSNPKKPLKLELAVYTSLQDARPRTTIKLSKANIKAPKFKEPLPVLNIFDKATKTRYKFASSEEGEKQQLQWFCNACKGIPQIMHSKMAPHEWTTVVPLSKPPPDEEDVELAMAINASLLSAMEEKPPSMGSITNTWESSPDGFNHNGRLSTGTPTPSEPSSSGLSDKPTGWGTTGMSSSSNMAQRNGISVIPITPSTPVPSAPPVPESADHPSIFSSPVDVTVSNMENKESNKVKEELCVSSSCVICLDAKVEGACIPCGHMAGCMSCLNEIKAKNWGCPVCRSQINQVIRLYAV